MTEFAPQTEAGHAAWAAALMPGVWTHAGLGGVVTGLNMSEALGRLDPDDADHPAMRFYLSEIEIGRLAAEAERRSADGEAAGSGPIQGRA